VTQILRNFIQEVAASTSDAKKRHLALHISTGSGTRKCYTLYDPSVFLDEMKPLQKALQKTGRAEGYTDEGVAQRLRKSIVGIIEFKKPSASAYGAKEVQASAAEKGYGPLMYDIAMMPLDDVMNPKTPQKFDDSYVFGSSTEEGPYGPGPYDDDPRQDEDVLNYAYALGDFPSIQALFDNDQNTFKDVIVNDLNAVFNLAFMKYFHNKYNS